MGLWSSIKNAAKKVWRAVKTVVRWGIKGLLGLIMRILHGVAEIFLFWVRKKLTVQIFILRDASNTEVIAPALFDPAIANAKAIFEKEFNVRIRFYGNPGVQILSDIAPATALDTVCDGDAFGAEFGEAGEYFADSLAGWVWIPISLRFPVSVFVVRSIAGKIGCSIPVTDYVTIAATNPNPAVVETGVTSLTTLAHELAHTCLLAHRNNTKNLLFPSIPRGTDTTWWQRRVLRTSRHCTFW